MFVCFDYAEGFIFSKNLKFIGIRLLFLNNAYMFQANLAAQDSMSKHNDSKTPPKQQQQNPHKQTNKKPKQTKAIDNKILFP